MMFGHVPRALNETIASGALRAQARDDAERSLLARLELTSYLRACTPLVSTAAVDDRLRAWWFEHGVFGVGIGVIEGSELPPLGLGSREAPPVDWARRLIVDRKARIVASRTLVPPDGSSSEPPVQPEGGTRVHDGLIEKRFTELHHDVLPLGDTFEATLGRLGRHTRRNLRKFTRDIEAKGVAFGFFRRRPTIVEDELHRLAGDTRPYPIPVRRIKKYERYCDIAGRSFRSVLKDKDGKLISYCCGFTEGSVAHVVYQLNQADWHEYSPSLVHRGYLMDTLGREGLRHIVFVHGCAGILARSCLTTTVLCRWLMRSDRTTRVLTSAAAKLMRGGYHGDIALQMIEHAKPSPGGTPP